MDKEKKIKIGLVCNKIATVCFVLFFIEAFAVPVMNMTFLVTSTIGLALIFGVCSIISHYYLKDYKPQ